MDEIVVFLGWVTPELSSRQNALYAAINEVGGYRCVRMEYRGQGDEDPESDSFCTELTADPESNIFMLILGEQYGDTVHKVDGKSYAEREYEAAEKAGVRRVALFVPEFEKPYAVSAERERQNAFRARVKADQETLSLAFETVVPDSDEDKFRTAMKDACVKTVVKSLDAMKSVLNQMK